MTASDALYLSLASLVDKDGVGAVPREQFARAARALGVTVPDEHMEHLARTRDPHSAGMLDFSDVSAFGLLSGPQIEPVLRLLAQALIETTEARRAADAHVAQLLEWRERELARQRRRAIDRYWRLRGPPRSGRPRSPAARHSDRHDGD